MQESSVHSSSSPAVRLPTTAVSIVVDKNCGGSGKHAASSAVRISVAAHVPHKRTSTQDPIRWTIQHWMFWDDRRQYTHLDALLTRLAPLAVVHLACTERAEAPPPRANGTPSTAAARKAQQVADLLAKLSQVISSRTDLVPSDNNSEGDAIVDLCHVHPCLPSHADLDGVLQHVLQETAYLAYRGTVLDELVQKALVLLLHGQGWTGRTDVTQGTCDLQSAVLHSHLVLDRTASETIHLLPPHHAAKTQNPSHASTSLFGILNHCRTKMGSRTLAVWLRQPLVDLEALQTRQEAVATLVDHGLARDRLRDEGLAGLQGVDLDALAATLASYGDDVTMGSTSQALECLYRLYILVYQQIPVMYEALQEAVASSASSSLLQSSQEGLTKVLSELSRSQQLVEAVLDLDQAPRHFLVKSSYHDDLEQVQQELTALEQELEQCHDDINQRWADVSGQVVGQVRLEGEGDGDWQFRLPNTNDSKVLSAQFGQSVTIHRMLKNGVYFSTKELRQLATKKQDLLAEYDKHQREIVVNAMKVAATYVPVLEQCSTIVAELDVIASLAHVAAYSPTGYCRPTLTDGEDDGMGIELIGARHPCVELQDSIEYIPNDIRLIFGESSFLLVTGPNMGGKSTYIRALGAIVTLAQIGSYVPCTSAKINLVHHILARVGAGDSQDRGISTFMAEMLESSSILRTATKRSLIIIDELGRGTSTFDGLGLATAISEYILHRVGCMTVFATHFHELTALEEREPSVQNCHVTATTTDSNGLTFLYEVRPGPCLESFGIQVAEMANVPQSVVMDAKRRAKQLEHFEYRKKARGDDDDEAFLDKFRQLPLQSFRTDEEKRQALMMLLQ